MHAEARLSTVQLSLGLLGSMEAAKSIQAEIMTNVPDSRERRIKDQGPH